MTLRNLIPWGRKAETRPAAYRDRDFGYSPVLALHREMNRLFDDVFRGFDFPAPFASVAGWTAWPSVEIGETDREVRVVAELPGLEEKDVELVLEDDALILRGEKRIENGEDDSPQFSERFYGRFERRIPLPEIEADKAKADFRNGVLTVTMPKTARAMARTRRIAINGRQ